MSDFVSIRGQSTILDTKDIRRITYKKARITIKLWSTENHSYYDFDSEAEAEAGCAFQDLRINLTNRK